MFYLETDPRIWGHDKPLQWAPHGWVPKPYGKPFRTRVAAERFLKRIARKHSGNAPFIITETKEI